MTHRRPPVPVAQTPPQGVQRASTHGAPPHSPRRPRLSDVAALAGVDTSVVSRALNADPKLLVRPETRQRILDAASALGYRPNAVARSLRRSTSGVYGLAIPSFSNPIYAEIISGAERAATSVGKHLLSSSFTDAKPESLVEVLGSGRIDGLIVAGTTPAMDVLLDGTGEPWLYLNRRSPGRPRHVVLDDEGAARLATTHLLRLGHERIGHVAGPEVADTATRRRSGFLAALRDAGMRAAARDIAVADYTSAGGAEAIGRLLATSRDLTAVFVANVASAVGVLFGADRAGLSVPGDLSVIAIHDLPMAEYLIPPLTTVRMPLFELGRRGVDILASQPATADVDEVVSEPMEIVARASTAPPPRVGAGRGLATRR
ncbi:MAG TPA: LacI family DNA-binding transcriptional regulator [Acidimicrobiales bacterium]|nr:LacI family DNA-binding transcriptional regulator [Acidimicrobiales bacterium]